MNTILGLFSGIHQNFKELMIILVVGLVIIALIKWPNGRIFVFTFCGLALVAFSIYAGSYLNYYYNATGGIYGKIESLYKPNQVQITDSVNYSFSNVTMTQDFDDHYSARIESAEVLDFNMDEDATYAVYVNGVPCKDSTVQEDYILAYYEYVFYGEDLTTVLMQDTLTLKFAFYTNHTTLIISTDGGAEAVKYWNYYFNKNLFEVTINNEGFGYADAGVISPATPVYNQLLKINKGIAGSSLDIEGFTFDLSVDGTIYTDIHDWEGLVDKYSNVVLSLPEQTLKFSTTDCIIYSNFNLVTSNCELKASNNYIFNLSKFKGENIGIDFTYSTEVTTSYTVYYDSASLGIYNDDGNIADNLAFSFTFGEPGTLSSPFVGENDLCGYALEQNGEIVYDVGQSVVDIYTPGTLSVTLYGVMKTNTNDLACATFEIFKNDSPTTYISSGDVIEIYRKSGITINLSDWYLGYSGKQNTDTSYLDYIEVLVDDEWIKADTFTFGENTSGRICWCTEMHLVTLQCEVACFSDAWEDCGWTVNEDYMSVSQYYYHDDTGCTELLANYNKWILYGLNKYNSQGYKVDATEYKSYLLNNQPFTEDLTFNVDYETNTSSSGTDSSGTGSGGGGGSSW